MRVFFTIARKFKSGKVQHFKILLPGSRIRVWVADPDQAMQFASLDRARFGKTAILQLDRHDPALLSIVHQIRLATTE